MSGKGEGTRLTNRKKRAEIARETKRIVEEGSYQCSGRSETVVIQDLVEAAKSQTRMYDCEHMPELPGITPRLASDGPCEIEVTNESTVSAIQRAAAVYSQDQLHIGSLNFASAKNPGGGFDSGAQAQEEALSRASALVPCLQTQMEGFYSPQRRCKSTMYLDLAIVSPGVPFFRDGVQEAELLPNPVLSTVISTPAPNAGNLRERGWPENEIDLTLHRRAEMILRLAAHYKVDVLILGAWGCGVFGNKPDKVAEIFRLLLEGNYQRHFRRVIFAVLDRTEKQATFQTFSKILGERQSPILSALGSDIGDGDAAAWMEHP